MDLNDLKSNPEQIQNLISVLQQLLDTTKTEEQNDQENSSDYISPIKTKNKKRNTNNQQQPNKFLHMGEKDMHKEDTSIDKKLSKFAPVARSRPFEMIDVVCRVCGKKETISPSLLFEAADRYKCNNCSTQSG
jgi:hypothetical protein